MNSRLPFGLLKMPAGHFSCLKVTISCLMAVDLEKMPPNGKEQNWQNHGIMDQAPRPRSQRSLSSVLLFMLSEDIRNLEGFGGNPNHRCGTPSPPSTGLIEEESTCAKPTSGAAMGNPTGHEGSACNKGENACSKASILALHNWWESQIEYESDSSDEGF